MSSYVNVQVTSSGVIPVSCPNGDGGDALSAEWTATPASGRQPLVVGHTFACSECCPDGRFVCDLCAAAVFCDGGAIYDHALTCWANVND